MCNYWRIGRYNCGHEEIAPEPEPGTLCLFKEESICNEELGLYRILDIFINEMCRECRTKLQQQKLQIRTAKKNKQPPPQFDLPQADPKDLAKQLEARKQLRATGRIPQQPSKRKGHISTLMSKNTAELLKGSNVYTLQGIVWTLRYTASLPDWLPRDALVDSLSPWFGPMFDEENQVSLRYTLQLLGLESLLDNVMVWRPG